ncbi:MAG: DMT family transporter [Ilumatobacteraceae bacterium]
MTAASVTRERLPVVPSLLAVTAGVVWGFGTILKRVAEDTDAFQYLIWRSIGTIVVIECISALRGRPFPTLRAWRSGRAMIAANLGLFVASLAYVYAVDTTTPANAAFLGSLTPLVAVVFARFLGERLAPSTIVALAVGLAGLLVTVMSDLEAGSVIGNLAAFAASIGFAVYTVAIRTDTTKDWSAVLPGYGLLMIVVCSIVTVAKGNTLLPPLDDTLYAVAHGAVFIVGGTTMFNWAAKHVPAVPMIVFSQTETIAVPILAYVILDLAPKPLTIVGGMIILVAVVGKAVYDTAIGHRGSYLPPGDVQPS